MVNRNRYLDKLRWLFVALIVALLYSAVFSPSSPNLSGGQPPYPQAGVSKVYAAEINVQSAPSIKAAQPLSVTLSGQVYDAISPTVGIPAIVYIDPLPPVTTDQQGNYSVSLDPGSYSIRAVPVDHCRATNDMGQVNISGTMTLNFPINRKIDQFGHFCSMGSGNWVPGDQQVTLDQDGYYSTTLPADFNFNYYGLLPSQTQVNIYNYGFINFGSRHDTGQFFNSQIPNLTPPDNAIYVWWGDLTLDISSTVYTHLDPGPAGTRKFVVEWRNVKLPDPDPSRVNFEIVMQEGILADSTTGNIWLNYQSTGCTPADTCPYSHGLHATSGIEAIPDSVTNTNDGLQYSYNETALYDGLSAHLYLPPQGLIVGRVSDKHTPLHDPLPAMVQVLGTSRIFNTSVANNAVYTLSVGLGSYQVQASARRYQTLTQTVTLSTPGQVVTASFDLGSPLVNPVQPAYTDMWVYAGQTKNYNLAVNNGGELDMPWVLREAIDHNGGGLKAKSPPQLPDWATGSLSDPQQPKPSQPGSVGCNHANINVQRSYRAYDSPKVSLKPGNNLHIDYTMLTRPIGASPAVSPANILLYSDDNTSLFYDPNDALNSQLPVRALCTLGYNANTTGFYNDPDSFWSALLNPPSGGWDIVIIALEVRQDFGSSTRCNNSCWVNLKSYYDGGPNNNPPAGKVVMTTFDVTGAQTGGNPVDATDFFSGTMGAVARGPFQSPQPVYMWPNDQRDPFYTVPFSLTAITQLQNYGYGSKAGDFMDTNDVVGGVKAGYQTVNPIPGRAAVIASYDGRGVIASFRSSADVAGYNHQPPLHITEWWCNMINQVVSPPIEFGDIPWISESPAQGISPAGGTTNVTLAIDASHILTRTTIPFSGYLYLGSNDPHVPRIGIEIPLSLTVIMQSDPTPTPAPPPLVDLAVWSVTAAGPNNDHPVANQPTTMSVTLKNLGGIGGNSQFSVDMFYDQPTAPPFGSRCDTSQDPGCYQSVPALNANSSTTITFTHNFTTPGVHRIWVIVNTDLHQIEPTQALANNIGGAYACMGTRTGPTFSDVPINPFSYIAVEYLACRGVVSGIGGGLFAPNQNTTRAQFSRMVAKGFSFTLTTPTGGGQSFTDVPPTYFAYNYIETLKALNVVSGFDQATCTAHRAAYPCFLPNLNITRGQLSIFIWRAKKLQNPVWAATPVANRTTFNDVQPGDIDYIAIQILSSYGVISGATNANCSERGINPPCFLPNDNGTRAALSVLLYKALSRP
jgi:S-layer homology domain